MQGVDPVGACVGPRGSRVRMVVSELRGEKIDIIPWNDEPARFVAKALAPAKVREVYVDDDARQATVVVPDGELSLAIGKEGLNARLAHRLTGWRIDIVSETELLRRGDRRALHRRRGRGGRVPRPLRRGDVVRQALSQPGARRKPLLRRPAHRELAAMEEGGGRVVTAIRSGSAPAAAGGAQGRTAAAGVRRRDDRLRHGPAAAGARRLPVSRSGLPDAGDTQGGVGQAVEGAIRRRRRPRAADPG